MEADVGEILLVSRGVGSRVRVARGVVVTVFFGVALRPAYLRVNPMWHGVPSLSSTGLTGFNPKKTVVCPSYILVPMVELASRHGQTAARVWDLGCFHQGRVHSHLNPWLARGLGLGLQDDDDDDDTIGGLLV